MGSSRGTRDGQLSCLTASHTQTCPLPGPPPSPSSASPPPILVTNFHLTCLHDHALYACAHALSVLSACPASGEAPPPPPQPPTQSLEVSREGEVRPVTSHPLSVAVSPHELTFGRRSICMAAARTIELRYIGAWGWGNRGEEEDVGFVVQWVVSKSSSGSCGGLCVVGEGRWKASWGGGLCSPRPI